MPGGHSATTSLVEHQDLALAGGNMVAGDGDVVGAGTSFIRCADGALALVTGFFDAAVDA